ncbi:MAG: DNA-directed RNA polymerase subunit beta' [Parcubacteria group bacterium]|nr:DNA-directed RNA polymerase subunit beta' [Parcubacteria group bacterium]
MDFSSIRVKLASPEDILNWSHGEVTKPETINYRTQRPEPEGLFSEKIFGPQKDWECYCGKYRRIRYKGIICDRCGVEVTRSIVRRERMGHISLAAPVAHIWFLRGVPSRMAMLLDSSLPELEKVIYFAAYIVTRVNEEAKTEAMKKLESEFRSAMAILKKKGNDEKELEKLRAIKERERLLLRNIQKYQILSEVDYRELSLKYAEVFEAGIGAEAVKKLLSEIDLNSLAIDVENKLTSVDNPFLQKKIVRRLKLLKGLAKAGIRPEWMFLDVIPVIPPDLRPMVQLDGGRFATSDLNDLYRRVINRNNRLKHLIELRAPEVITRNEKRMLQEAVDSLIDNAMRRGQTITTSQAGQRRALRSLADMLKGKQGRFRQNLLGKRVDYSGRSVIVIGPELNFDQCGLPKHMALELFKPFVIQKLKERGIIHNIPGARRLIEQESPEVWEALEEAIKDKLVLLNRAPTLHRLGIQAFRPILHEGKAIRIPAMPTHAFNADFDGDQMAVHLPLTKEAQEEAKNLMLSSKGILKPATGRPIATPTKDIAFGIYYLTLGIDGLIGEGKVFGSPGEALMAYDNKCIELHSKIKVRFNSNLETATDENIKSELVLTTVGRILFSKILPSGMAYVNQALNKSDLEKIEATILEKYGETMAADFLNNVKDLGFFFATVSGISWSMDDLRIPEEKHQIVAKADELIEKNHELYEQGLLTDLERKIKAIEIWNDVKSEIGKSVKKALRSDDPVKIIVDSKARGSWDTVNQLMGIRGLFANPAGEIIELPVKNSFKEGLNVLEYFISTHGARKGLADTALRTATAGYLTRRLVDVAQDIVVREEDCKDSEGYDIYREDGNYTGETLGGRVRGRFAAETIKSDTGEIIAKKGELIDKAKGDKMDLAKLNQVRVRSVITCKSRIGLCQTCYGYDLGRNKIVELGESVGIVTAQAIGEPGTQLTMRTFHTGGVAASGDITLGLPRVEEIFEARIPRSPGVISDVDGRVVSIEEKGKQKIVKIEITKTSKEGGEVVAKPSGEIREMIFHHHIALTMKEGDVVIKGQPLSEGHLDLKELFMITGRNKAAVARYITREIESIYFTSGEGIHDKHVELIIRQMFSRVRIIDSGDTDLLAGEIMEVGLVLNENDRVIEKGKKPAQFEQLLLGITKVSLTTESFLSAASFQETARVLIDASIMGKEDRLRGLKENVIIGRLIPAGTGYRVREEGGLV